MCGLLDGGEGGCSDQGGIGLISFASLGKPIGGGLHHSSSNSYIGSAEGGFIYCSYVENDNNVDDVKLIKIESGVRRDAVKIAVGWRYRDTQPSMSSSHEQ